jgi:spermidine synthase
LEDAGLKASPYHAYVPSFGEWGYIIGSRNAYNPPQKFNVPVRYLTPETMKTMFDFPADMSRVDAEVNRLNNQVLVRYFEEEWRRVMK